VPLGSVFVEVEDVKGTVAAFDFAIAVIGTVPLVENFDDLDPMSLQTKRMGDLNPSVLARLNLDAHVSASAAASTLSNRCRHNVESKFSWSGHGLLLNDSADHRPLKPNRRTRNIFSVMFRPIMGCEAAVPIRSARLAATDQLAVIGSEHIYL
jgi:hypothetical protein